MFVVLGVGVSVRGVRVAIEAWVRQVFRVKGLQDQRLGLVFRVAMGSWVAVVVTEVGGYREDGCRVQGL